MTGPRATPEEQVRPVPVESGGAEAPAVAVAVAVPATDGADARRSRGMRFALASFAVTVVLSLGSSVATARLYGVEVVGEFALASAPWFLLMQLSVVGEHVAMIRSLSVLPARSARANATMLVTLAFSVTVAAVTGAAVAGLSALVLAGPVGRPDLVAPAVVLIAGYVLLDRVSWVLDMAMSAFHAGRELFWVRLLQLLAILTASVVAFQLGQTVEFLVAGTVVGMAVGLLGRLVVIRPYLAFRAPLAEARRALGALPEAVAFGLKLLPGGIAGGISVQIGTWVLGALSTVASVGAYARATGLAARLQEAGFRICEMLFPTLVQGRAAGDEEAVTREMLRVTRLTVAGLCLVSAVGSGASGAVLRVFGPGFDEAAPALGLLLFAMSFTVLAMLQNQALTAYGRPSLASNWALLRVLVVAVTVVPAAVTADTAGVAASLLAASAVEVVGKDVAYRRDALAHVRSPDHRRTVLAAAGAGLLAGPLSWYVAEVAVAGSLEAPAGLVVGSVVYAVVFLALGGLTPSERQVLGRRLSLRRKDRSR